MSDARSAVFGVVAVTAALVAPAPAYAQAERPNILLVLTDDQVDIATGCYGNPQVKTPQMDRLAAEGVLFGNHYNTTSICMASRATIMTGMYEYKIGCNFMHGPLARETFKSSYPVLLRSAGYFTGFAGKFGFAVKDDPAALESYNRDEDLPSADFDAWAGGPGQTHYQTVKNKGIARFANEYPHSTRAYAAWAREFFRAAKSSGKPFCLSISFKAPHLPFTPDPAFDHIYAGVTFKPPSNFGIENGTHLAPHTRTGRQFHGYRFWIDAYQDSIRAYHQLIHGADVALGMIRDALEAEGLADSTVIIFTSDNGYNCGAHGFGDKIFPYEEASRSPLVIYDPRLPTSLRGARRAAVTANIDLTPTILELAGVPIPNHVDGVSLLPLLKTPDALARVSVPLMNMWGNPEIQALAVVTRDWKYIYWSYHSPDIPATEELFHLAADRTEMQNLAGDPRHFGQLQRMRELYDVHLRHLARNAVPRNDYPKYEQLFERRSASP